MTAFVAILQAFVQILKSWKDFAVKAWKSEGEKIASELRDAKTDEDASKALKDLDDHMRGP